MQVRRNTYYTNYLLILMCCFTVASFSTAFAQNNGTTQGTSGNQANTVDIPTDEATVAEGRTLFGQHCTACHQVEQQIIGPALASVHQRRPLPWLISFIQNSQKVISSGDEYATQLYEQYNRVVMPNFEFLSNDNIISILAYIKAESTSKTSSGGVNGASSANNLDEETSREGGSEAYSQKEEEGGPENYPQQEEGGETSDEVSSGLSSGTFFAVLIGTLILVGIIFFVAKRSGKGKGQ